MAHNEQPVNNLKFFKILWLNLIHLHRVTQKNSEFSLYQDSNF